MIKKLTGIALIIFILVVGTVFAIGFIYPPNQSTTSGDIPQKEPGQNTASKTFSLADAALHNLRTDCWLVIDNKIYDVSLYLGSHPGGQRNITSRCGTEVTGVFASIHSNFAWNLLNKYFVANVSSANSSNSEQSATKNLAKISDAVMQLYPGAEVIRVKPKKDFYIAKIIHNGILSEIHLNSNGEFLKEEVENDEFDWSAWDSDSDDN
jgi:cytochrome b involved in lipid metabolism